MAITVDQASLGTPVHVNATSTTIALTTSVAVASGGLIEVTVSRWHASSTVTVAGGGLTWVEDVTILNANVRTSIFRAHAPAGLASATTITATFSVGSDGRAISGSSYVGAATSTPVEITSSSSAGAAGAWSAGSLTTTTADCLIVAAGTGDGATTTSTPSAGYTERADYNDSSAVETWTVIDQITTGTGTFTPGGTFAASPSGSRQGVAVAYKPAGGGTTPATVTPQAANAVFAGTAAVTAVTTVAPQATNAVFASAASATATTAVVPAAADAVFASAATVTTGTPANIVPAPSNIVLATAGAVTAPVSLTATSNAVFATTGLVTAPTTVAPSAANTTYASSAVVTTPGSVTTSTRLPLIGVGN